MDRVYARGPNGPIHADEWDGETVTCYVTEEPLVHVKGHAVRAHKRLKADVRAHERHAYFRGNFACGSEMSVEHKAAQDKIVRAFEAGTPYTYETCVIPGESVKLERRIPYGSTHFDLDVGFMRGDQVVGAVEIWWKHEVGDEKAWELTQRFPWAEVRAEAVLAANPGACLPTCNSGRTMLLAVYAVAWDTVDVAEAAVRAARESVARAQYATHWAAKRVVESAVHFKCRAETAALNASRRAEAAAIEGAANLACAAAKGAVASADHSECRAVESVNVSVENGKFFATIDGEALGSIWATDQPRVRLLANRLPDGERLRGSRLREAQAVWRTQPGVRRAAEAIMHGICCGCFGDAGTWSSGRVKVLCSDCYVF